jgi:hypothetical protein
LTTQGLIRIGHDDTDPIFGLRARQDLVDKGNHVRFVRRHLLLDRLASVKQPEFEGFRVRLCPGERLVKVIAGGDRLAVDAQQHVVHFHARTLGRALGHDLGHDHARALGQAEL